MVVFYRKLPRFGYVRPRTLDEAFAALAPGVPVKHQVYAGGTDLLLKLKSREVEAPPRLIDLKGVTSLDYVRWHPEEGLRIGALATSRAVADSPVVREHFTALAQGTHEMGSTQLQNRGTVAGNVCNAVPSADSVPPLLAHDAKVVCIDREGERTVELARFFRGPGETALRPSELVKEIRVPPPLGGERSVYLRLAPRGRMDLAVVGAAVSAVVERGVVRSVRIGLGSAAPVPVRATEAEAALLGRPLTPEVIERGARVAAESSRTRSSHRASAEYRRMMIAVLVRRALTHLAAARAEFSRNGA